MTRVIDQFVRWWNVLTSKNGKLKFRTQKEAGDFIRRIQSENGGPNAKIQNMRKRYDEIKDHANKQNP